LSVIKKELSLNNTINVDKKAKIKKFYLPKKLKTK
jgi:hypothetical protein